MMPRPTRESFADADRSTSEVVAVVLLIGLVVLGVTALLFVGLPEFATGQETVEVSQAERALVQFDSEAGRVATGATSTQRIDLGLKANGGTLDVENGSGHVTITYIDVQSGNETEVMNESLGTVVYENGDTTVGYQGGGVWRSDGDNSVMASPPEIDFRSRTLTMPFVRTSGESVYSEVQIARAGASQRFPVTGTVLTNKVDDAIIRVDIRSRYYRAWGDFFREETGSIVQYDHTNNRVTVLFLTVPKNLAPNAGVIATSGPGELRVEGNGAYIDSYNSSQGSYADTKTASGKVKAAGDVTIKGDATIAGDTRSGRNISVGSNSKIDGNATATGSITVDGDGTITGNQTITDDAVVDQPPIDRLVEREVSEIRDDNDNNGTAVIQNEKLQIDATNDTLTAGQYYLENLDLQGETLIIDTSGGNVTIAVQNWIRLVKDGGVNSHIKVQGSGTVRLFVASDDRVDVSIPGGGQTPEGLDEVHLFVERSGSVEVPGQRSVRFQLYAPGNFVGALGGSSSERANVTMAVIAPSGSLGDGQFYVQQGDLYGAIVTGNLTLGQYGQVHFDRAILGTEFLLAPGFSRLDYLYIADYEIEVKSS